MCGKDRFRAKNLESVKDADGFREHVRCLAVARDADGDVQGTFKSVCTALRAAGLPAPETPGRFYGDNPKVGVLIISPNGDNGVLEDLCLASISEFEEIQCIDEFFQCVRERAGVVPKNPSKARIKAFLASREESVPHLGVGVEKGYFPLDSEVFEQIRAFLRAM